MDRQIIYPGSIPLETDLLNTNRAVMIALGKLVAATIGTATTANGLPCTQTTVPSMSVSVGAGEIYMLANLDGSAYSSLAADTTHQIVKQGVMLDAATLACPAPVTAGQSVVYLIQATYQDVDANSVVLPYYNSSNPAIAYSGPGGGGVAQFTQRKGAVVLSAKAGTPAATGSQVAPAADSGYVGLWWVTVANGAATVVNANIALATGAPFVSVYLTVAGAATTYAPINSPGLTGTPTAPTAAQDTSTTQVASTAFVLGQLSGAGDGTPAMDGSAGRGGSTHGARADHVHPTDASRAPLASPGLTGTPTAPTAAPGTNTTQLATTAFAAALALPKAGGTMTGALVLAGNAVLALQAVPKQQLDAAIAGLGGGGAQSLTANGYQTLPGGLILQWFSVSFPDVPAGNPGYVGSATFPLVFPNACFVCIPGGETSPGNLNNWNISVTSKSATGINFQVEEWSASFNPGVATFIAIGY